MLRCEPDNCLAIPPGGSEEGGYEEGFHSVPLQGGESPFEVEGVLDVNNLERKPELLRRGLGLWYPQPKPRIGGNC